MPASKKGVLKTTGKRFNPLTRDFVKQFRKQTGIKIKFEDFCQIVYRTNELMADAIANDDAGLKLPNRLGHIVVNKYKSLKPRDDWYTTVQIKKKVPFLNLHSFGYIHHIKWFTLGCRFQNRNIYKFKAIRPLTRQVAKNIKNGRLYHQWSSQDFWSLTRIERWIEGHSKTKKRKTNTSDNS